MPRKRTRQMRQGDYELLDAQLNCILMSLRQRCDIYETSSPKSSRDGLYPKQCLSGSLISNILQAFVGLLDLGLPSSFCLAQVEDGLQNIHQLSQLLTTILQDRYQARTATHAPDADCAEESAQWTLSHLTEIMGVTKDDIPLLLAVASTHTPDIVQLFSKEITINITEA
eukprot:m.83634 g.83634  ORF g.83634 m.83634 type:complete len:170 (+) comp21133_c0_seq4:35-544(+)